MHFQKNYVYREYPVLAAKVFSCGVGSELRLPLDIDERGPTDQPHNLPPQASTTKNYLALFYYASGAA